MVFAALQIYKRMLILPLNVRKPAILSQPNPSDGKVNESGQGVSHAVSAERAIALRGNRLDSRELFAAGRELIIVHGEDAYRLRLTAQNKLILTK